MKIIPREVGLVNHCLDFVGEIPETQKAHVMGISGKLSVAHVSLIGLRLMVGHSGQPCFA